MGDKNLHKNHRERLRKRALTVGLEHMPEHEVLELLLTYAIPQKDVNPLAHELISHFGSFYAVLEADVSELKKIKGISEYSATLINLMKQFMFFYKINKRKKLNKKVFNTITAVNFIKPYLEDKTHEEVYIICLDGNCNVLGFEKVSIGTSNEAAVYVRRVTECAIKNKSHNIIVCHNHPGGVCKPSIEDDLLTRVLYVAMAMNNINLLDHIIITENENFSYKTSGALDTYVEEAKRLTDVKTLKQLKCKYA